MDPNSLSEYEYMLEVALLLSFLKPTGLDQNL